MMATETPLSRFYAHVHEAAEGMQDEGEERHVPSPSTVSSCRLRQWFQGTGFPRTDRIPVDSLKKMESGRVIEDFWREVYTRAGFLVVSPTPPVEVGTMKSKGGDGILFIERQDTAELLSEAVGERLDVGASLLLELKDLGAWSYMDLAKSGVKEGLPDYWMQVQSYLQAYGRNYCIFHAGMADASGTKFIWKRIRGKEMGDYVPPFLVEVIKREPADVMEALNRATEVRWNIDNPRGTRVPIEIADYDSTKLYPQGKYPCGYCGWGKLCVEAQNTGGSVGNQNN